MEILKGIAASPGYGIGRTVVVGREDVPIGERFVPRERVEAEVRRYEEAVSRAQAELEGLQRRMREEVSEGAAAIFIAHSWVLSDGSLREEVIRRIRDNSFTAEYAVDRALQKYVKRLRALDDSYLQQRIHDLEDIERRLVSLLQGGRRPELDEIEGPVIVVAHSLTPSQTASFTRDTVLGIATDVGGRTGHAAILARDLGIPAVVGLRAASSDVSPGDVAIVDGRRGVIIISPDERTVEKYREFQEDYLGLERQLTEESHAPADTSDGVTVSVFGNIEFPEEIPSVVEHGAEGIGLYRTEFLFLRSGKMPTEEDHIEAYRAALSFLGGRPIVIRTLDIGADKFASVTETGGPVVPAGRTYVRNPYFGCRSIRLCQSHPGIFRTQIRAILRASAEGQVKCMLPMISTLEELRWAKGVIDDVKAELDREGVEHDPNTEVGIMIEVPAAAVMAEMMAREVAFFSIGTNDLIQYTLAVDRTDERAAPLFTPAEPGVLRLIQMVIDAGERHDIPVSMCGEMAGDPLFAELLLGMGLRRFSVSPAQAPIIKKIIRSVSTGEAKELAESVLALETHHEIIAALKACAEGVGATTTPPSIEGLGGV